MRAYKTYCDRKKRTWQQLRCLQPPPHQSLPLKLLKIPWLWRREGGGLGMKKAALACFLLHSSVQLRKGWAVPRAFWKLECVCPCLRACVRLCVRVVSTGGGSSRERELCFRMPSSPLHRSMGLCDRVLGACPLSLSLLGIREWGSAWGPTASSGGWSLDVSELFWQGPVPADSFGIRSEVVVLAKKPFSKKPDLFSLTHKHAITLYTGLCDLRKIKRIRLQRGASHLGSGPRLSTS